MGMDYGASRYDIIDEDVILKTCKKEFLAFKVACDNASNTSEYCDADGIFDAFARETERNDDDYDIQTPNGGAVDFSKVEKTYKKLRAAFLKKTKLQLHAGYVGEGLRGSDICEEAFWHIMNSTIPNPDLVKLMKACKSTVSEQWFLDAG